MSANGKDISMWMQEARQAAAQCWCDEDTSGMEMDTVLCEAIARRIAAWMDTGAFHARNEEYWRDRAIKAESILRAALDAKEVEAVAPDGWQLIPQNSDWFLEFLSDWDHFKHMGKNWERSLYKAMLLAAPSPAKDKP